jgi:hypothetical protein
MHDHTKRVQCDIDVCGSFFRLIGFFAITVFQGHKAAHNDIQAMREIMVVIFYFILTA